jgi:hypothetical protein
MCVLALLAVVCVPAAAQKSAAPASNRLIDIPRVERAPTLDEFLDMDPGPEWTGKLAAVDGFVQRTPRDGDPPSQRTVAYLGYDQQNFYAVFVCFDTEPGKVRARMSRREDVFSDDNVQVLLDTFHDQRRAYSFIVNPLGVQWDALWTEGQNFDDSFDTVWHSEGKLTDRGYVVLIAIPFKSLRFSTAPQQTWGVMLYRGIPRGTDEEVFWPQYSQRIQGRMNQAATARGLENISPGRNIQIIPYGVLRSFRAIDDRDPTVTRFTNQDFEADGGVDAKFVIKDSFVLDVTGNPDFSQVESDEPQVVVNQRFEVFFEEKRPFFLENANYFSTPIDLLFTRRIADPRFGVRLTGKKGPWAVGALFADDQSPGKVVPEGHELEGSTAYFGVVRINRDILKQSTIGITLTDREYDGSSDSSLPAFLRTNYNRVGSVDTRIRLGPNWQFEGQAVTSATQFADGSRLAGPAYNVEIRRSGYNFEYEFEYNDYSPGYRTQTGFVSRTDIRQASNFAVYVFRPKNHPWLISVAPNFFHRIIYDHDGTLLDWAGVGELRFDFRKQSYVTFNYGPLKEVLRPADFPVLSANREYAKHQMGIYFGTTPIKQLRFSAQFFKTRRINFVPGAGLEPHLADGNTGNASVTVQPMDRLRIENLYLFSRLTNIQNGTNIFNNHIFRSKWNYQFTRELSVRFIGQYDTLISNPDPAVTQLPTIKNFNVDFLVTYLLNPGTALYVGYNSNLQNLDPTATFRTTSDFINDAKGLFVKFSYLFRF